MPYLYETHLHTSQASVCAVSRGREYIRRYLDLGYTGIIVTDHFFRGNSSIDRRLPWREKVELFCRGYEDAREEGEKRGLDVFFGWEESFAGDDYLVYGLDKKWLLEHPESGNWTRKEQFQEVSAAGGCVVQAHPFRQHYYIRRIILAPYLVHGVEAANAGNGEAAYDGLAWVYAKKLKLPVTAGSDIHSAADVRQGGTFGVYLDKKLNSVNDYALAVRNDALAGLEFSPGRCDFSGDTRTSLPVDIRDDESQVSGHDVKKFLGL
jgi:hypothetical protein